MARRGDGIYQHLPQPIHIAAIDFPTFYARAFPSPDESVRFFKSVEALEQRSRGRVKSVLHQAARMLWLSDRMGEVARGRPALQVLFFLIAAESVAKLVCNFTGEKLSRKYVRLFFSGLCEDEHRDRLSRAFRLSTGSFLPAAEAVDFLYDVRCDVAHQGRYFMMDLPHSPDSEPTLTSWKSGVYLVADITAAELRQIVLEGAVLGAKQVIAAEEAGDT